jgi:hypothetical protein
MFASRSACILLALAAMPASARSAPTLLEDGTFKVYQSDRAVGAETFSYERSGDSLMVLSNVYQTIPTSDGGQVFEKKVLLLTGAFDYALRQYQSEQKFRQQTLVRGIEPHDTTVTLYRELNGRGEGTSYTLPPGRPFVIDAGVFTLFDVICRNLHRQSFQSRPILVVALGTRDSVYEARATDLGTETIRWGAKPIQARKLEIGDAANSFIVWVAPAGHMLRLQHAASGLRVERDAPKIKSAARRAD